MFTKEGVSEIVAAAEFKLEGSEILSLISEEFKILETESAGFKEVNVDIEDISVIELLLFNKEFEVSTTEDKESIKGLNSEKNKK